MRHSRTIGLLLALVVLAAPALALGSVRRGVYIDNTKNVQINTNKSATALKLFTVDCSVGGQVVGTIQIKKPIKLSRTGSFVYKGRASVVNNGSTVVSLTIKGKIGKKAVGKVTYSDAPAKCDPSSFSAKYYGVNPQG